MPAGGAPVDYGAAVWSSDWAAVPAWFAFSVVAVFGAVVGSFLNVLIWRMPRDESIVSPGSHCPRCNTPLSTLDLVPLFSFLLARGYCRYCGTRLSWRYFGVEALTAALFVLLYWRLGPGAEFLFLAAFTAILVAVFFIDLEHKIIPDQLNIALGVVAVGRDLVHLYGSGAAWPHLEVAGLALPGSLPAGAGFALFLWAVAAAARRIYGREAMGMGDVKMAFGLGAILLTPWLIGLAFFLSVASGALIGGLLVALRSLKRMRSEIAFGPFLAIGTLTALLFGERLVGWYRAWAGL